MCVRIISESTKSYESLEHIYVLFMCYIQIEITLARKL